MFLLGSNWKVIRISLLVLFAFIMTSVQPTLETIIVPHITINSLMFGVVASFFSTLILIWVQSKNPKQNVVQWKVISWNINPFSIKQPILFFNFVGWFMLASYIIPAVLTYMQFPEFMLDGLFLVLLGVSVIVATHVAQFIFVQSK